jgi:hypothetical protein
MTLLADLIATSRVVAPVEGCTDFKKKKRKKKRKKGTLSNTLQISKLSRKAKIRNSLLLTLPSLPSVLLGLNGWKIIEPCGAFTFKFMY